MIRYRLALLLVWAAMALQLAACSGLGPPTRGVDESNLSVFFSTANPGVKITFADRFRYEGEINNVHVFTGPDQTYAAVLFRPNPHRYSKKVDYYYPIDRVLNESISRNGGMAHRYGKTVIGGRQLDYCYGIFPEADQFEIQKYQVIRSQDHDWLVIVFGKQYAYTNFREDYGSAQAYFAQNPDQLARFDDAFKDAIRRVERYSDESESGG